MATKEQIIKFDKGNSELFAKLDIEQDDSTLIIIVPETHYAILVVDGELMNTLESGRHTLPSAKKTLWNNKSDQKHIEIVYISKTVKAKILWGTRLRMELNDPVIGELIKIGASGELDITVANPRKFYLELVGMDTSFSINSLKDMLLGRILSCVELSIIEVMKSKMQPLINVTDYKSEITQSTHESLRLILDREYGLRSPYFGISLFNIPLEDIALSKRRMEDSVENERIAMRSNAIAKYGDKMYCIKCGDGYNIGARFCPACGDNIVNSVRVCDNCDSIMPSIARYCPKCGKMI